MNDVEPSVFMTSMTHCTMEMKAKQRWLIDTCTF